jgi:hypothetical protein
MVMLNRVHLPASVLMSNVPLIAFKNPNLQARYHVGSFLEILELPPFGEKTALLEQTG